MNNDESERREAAEPQDKSKADVAHPGPEGNGSGQEASKDGTVKGKGSGAEQVGNGSGGGLNGQGGGAQAAESAGPGSEGAAEIGSEEREAEMGPGEEGDGVFAKAAAFGKAIGNGTGAAEDLYLWEEGVAVEPWDEPVDGKELLNELTLWLKRYVVLAQWSAETLALWIAHTYAFELRPVATYIGIESPEKRCGKTTLLTGLCELVNRPIVASNISSPAFYRVIEDKKPTLLIDEWDTVLHRNRELKGILNSGYKKRTAYVIRMTPKANAGGAKKESAQAKEATGKGQGNGLELGRFSSWCPKVIATIKHLPETLADRCIIIRMDRKTSKEKCERMRNLDGKDLRRKCARFVADHAQEIAKAQPELPEDLNDRAADIWEPLLAIADLAGGDWAEKARQAAVALTVGAQEESPIGTLLLDIWVLLLQQESDENNQWMKSSGGVRMFSRDIVAGLNRSEDRPWVVMRRGKEVTERWLSQQLNPYGVRPRTIWIGEVSAKGYMAEDFTETFRRYIPKAMAQAFLDEQASMRKRYEAEKTRLAEEARKQEGDAPSGT